MATYTEEMVDSINSIVGDSLEVTLDDITNIAAAVDMSEKSVGAKLRRMGITTPKKTKKAAFTEAETAIFKTLVSQGLNAEQIGEQLGKSSRQVYGKALSMKLHVTSPEKTEYVKKYSEAEEAQIADLVGKESYIEEIADALGRTVAQIRGKLLSMKLKAEQRDKKSATRTVIYTEELVATLISKVQAGDTAENIAEALGLNVRGVKSRIGKLLKAGQIEVLPSDMGVSTVKTLVDYTPELISKIEGLAAKGYTSAEAAEELDIPVASLRSKSGRLKIKFAKPVKAKAEAEA